MGNDSAAFAIFPSTVTAGIAVERLALAGFSSQDVSVLLSDKGEMKKSGAGNNAQESLAAGAGVGAVLGGTLGLLGGIAAFATPGLGPLIVAGPVCTANESTARPEMSHDLNMRMLRQSGVAGAFTGRAIAP